jgi:hypothetical protein
MQDEPDAVARAERKADEARWYDEWKPACSLGDVVIADVATRQETRISRKEIDREMAEDGYRMRTNHGRSRVICRTRTRARSSLRSGRPSCSRRTSSRSSAASGDPDSSDDPEPAPRGTAARLSYAVLTASERGAVVA